MKKYISKIKGNCHCGNIQFEFETDIDLGSLAIRSCQCRFCKLHGAATARDPNGRAKILIDDLDSTKIYRFATESTDFLLCANCGVYVGAVLASGGKKYATLNMKLSSLNTNNAEPIIYGDETAEDRIAQRVDLFTPVEEFPF
jgi:hypothetical protein